MPVWGKLADKKGRKVVLLSTSFGLATVSFLTGFSVNIYMLIFHYKDGIKKLKL